MDKKRKHLYFCTLAMVLLLQMIAQHMAAFAADEDAATVQEQQKYYIGAVVNAGKDTGYSEENEISEKDPHYGWELGRFFVSGYTRLQTEEYENPVFLKNVGDTVTLWFNLEENIDQLHGAEALSIAEDKNGFDRYFETQQTNFGRGTLIVRHTDYQNAEEQPVIYTDYLSAVKTEADTEIQLCEEGDYEIALDYEIENAPRKVLGHSVVPIYTNYRIFARFSVRNGNCMVYPFDSKTGEELTNSDITENGFYLDLAKSRYLDVNIKKEVLAEGANGLTEDTRFNRPAKDGDTYTEEGIYTITVHNRYTEQQTEKSSLSLIII